MEDDREIQDWFAATRPAAPSPALQMAVLEAAERQRPRRALRLWDVPALAASALLGVWLGYAPLQDALATDADGAAYAALDIADALTLEETP